VAHGTPEEIAANPESHTGRFLAPILARHAPMATPKARRARKA
jgi:excinuclease ABC subunit A